jgi:hypothetical protein
MSTPSRFVLTAAFLTVSPILNAAIYGTNNLIEYIGSRTESSGQVTTGGNYATDGQNFQIAWTIVDNGNGTFNYRYELTNFGAPDISHFILDLTDDCVTLELSACLTNISVTGGFTTELGTFDASQGNSNVGIPGPIAGIKFDDTAMASGAVISFTSTRSPVWGDFYFNGGNSSYIFNTGLLPANRLSTDISLFIARPNGDTGIDTNDIPEPSALALLGSGLLALGLAARRRRR